MLRELVLVAVAGWVLLASGCGGDSRPASRPPAAKEDSAPSEAEDASQESAPSEEGESAGEKKAESEGEPSPAAENEAEAGDTKELALERLKMIGGAMQAYEEQNQHFPPAATYDAAGRPLLSWRVALLPLLGEEELYQEFHQDEPWDSPHNKALQKRMPNVYRTPGGPALPKTCYLVPLGAGSAISQREGMSKRDVQPGTALVVEVNPQAAVTWTQPQDWHFVPASPAMGLGKLRDGEFCCVLANGQSQSSSATEPTPEALRALFNAKAKKSAQLGSEDASPAEDSPEAKSEEGFRAQATTAFGEGQEIQGLAYLMAEAVVQGDGEVLDTLRWSPALRLPMLTTRWGVAVQSPLPAKPVSHLGGSRRTMESRQVGEGSSEHESGEAEEVRFWREHFIQPLIHELQLRVTSGQFGKWLKGHEQTSGDAGGEHGDGAGRWPGIVLFNAASAKEARQRAEKDKLDLLLVVEVSAKPTSKGRQAVLALRLQEMAKGTELWHSKPINSVQVMLAKEGGKGGDPVKDLIDELMKFVDEKLQLAEMPPISREAAQRRAASLVGQKPEYPLPTLMELRYYQRNKLLTPEELTAHYGALLGQDEGARLAGGSEADRLKVVARWLPKETKPKE
jgi:hypothetical protein